MNGNADLDVQNLPTSQTHTHQSLPSKNCQIFSQADVRIVVKLSPQLGGFEKNHALSLSHEARLR